MIEGKYDFLDFFTYKKKPYKLLYSTYDITKVRYAFKRRFLFQKHSIEIIFKNCDSITINFRSDEDWNKFEKVLKEINHEYKQFFKPFRKAKITEKWQRGEISNFKYIMLLNYYGSRSYNDLSQYPVIPWFLDYDLYIASELDEQDLKIRNMELNLAKLGTDKRLKEFMARYETLCNEDQAEKYFIGSHYSNPGIILMFLVRISPFLDGHIKFQSNKIDWADRIFSGMADSFLLALTENGDVRELIPETLCLPEMYKNNWKVNFGTTQTDIKVDSVRLPGWANNDPYYFTCKTKELFEHGNVNMNLHNWIDLIFGHKQRGEKAVEAWNLYLPITYEDGIDMNDPENIEFKSSLTVQAYNYGQCPTQLFVESHPKKDFQAGIMTYVDDNTKYLSQPFYNQKINYGIISICKFIDESNFIAFGSRRKLYQFSYNRPTEAKNNKKIITENKDWKKIKIEFDDSKIFINEETPMKILSKNGICILLGGYWDGSLSYENYTKNKREIKKKHLYRITCIEVSESEEIIITGTEKGDIAKWVSDQHNTLIFEWPFFHHEDTVTNASICENMGVFATWSKDGTANLYTISPAYILRSFKQRDCQPLSRILISETPLASIIIGKLN